jgi:hypothetical protein
MKIRMRSTVEERTKVKFWYVWRQHGIRWYRDDLGNVISSTGIPIRN